MKNTFTAVLLCMVAAITLSTGAQTPAASRPQDFAAFKIISERNIFDPNRRPHLSSGPAPKIVDSFALVGTMFYGTNSLAVFEGSHSEYRKVLEPGGSIAGQVLRQIGPEAVKLSSGSNELELKVGMQMRRNEDGQWSVGNQPESSLQAYQPDSSRSTTRRRSEPGARRSEPQNSQPDATDVPDAPPAPDLDTTNAPPVNAGGDPNDPVARMMRRRAQEAGNENNNSNP
ncbi:MAG TPA: hypothetical protein VFD66_14430 [Verrucomicrobiae bacterium]|nr:hypothetical protein [Verrucomicrobiae bacterium]